MAFEFTAAAILLGGALISYLLGSVNSALIFTRLFLRKDVREMGSGNAGMTNAFRTAGPKVGLLTLAGDLLKVILSVAFGRYLLFPLLRDLAPAQETAQIFHPTLAAFFCGFFCLIGHVYPIYFGFKGGKGVLTALGTVLMVDWRLVIPTLGTFLLVLFLTRYVSVASMTAAVTYPVATYFLYDFIHEPGSGFDFGFWNLRRTETLIAAAFALLIWIKHRSNIQRLLKGTENKIGGKKADECQKS